MNNRVTISPLKLHTTGSDGVQRTYPLVDHVELMIDGKMGMHPACVSISDRGNLTTHVQKARAWDFPGGHAEVR